MALRPGAAQGRRLDGAALAALAILVGLYFSPWLWQGLCLGSGDYPVLMAPAFHWMHGLYGQGRAALWMQSVGAGEPLGDAMATLDDDPPARLLLTLFQAHRAYALVLALRLVCLAWGAYLLARQSRASRLGALLGALAAAFAGGPVFSFVWPTVLATLAWTPWMLLGLARLQSGGARSRWSGAALLGLAVGLGFSGGYPGMVLLAMLPLGLMHAAWLRTQTGGGEARHAAWRGLAAAIVVAGLLSAGPLHGLRRLSGQSMRGEALSPADAARTSMTPMALAQAVAPNALGREADGSFLGASWRFGSFEPQGMVLYVGLAGLILAAVGFAGGGLFWPWGASLALLILYALGHWTPFHGWVSRLPAFDHLRAPVKAGLFAGTLLCVPIARGFDRLGQRALRWPARTMALLGLALGLAALALWLGEDALMRQGRAYIEALVQRSGIHHRSPDFYAQKLQRWLLSARAHLLAQAAIAVGAAFLLGRLKRLPRAAGLALAALLLLDLGYNSRAALVLVPQALLDRPPATLQWLKERQAQGGPAWRMMVWGRQRHIARNGGGSGEDPAALQRLRAMPFGNEPSVLGLEQADGYTITSLFRSRALRTWAADDQPDADIDALTRELLRRRRLLDLAAVRYIISSVPLDAPGFRLARPGDPAIYENLRALPEAYLATAGARVDDAAGALAALGDAADPRARWPWPAWVEAPAGSALGLGQGTARFVERSDQCWDLDVDAEAAGTLVLSRLYYRGLFQASVDGAPAPVHPANAAFCAIPVPAGRHRVRLEARDPWGRALTALFWAGLLLPLGLILFAARSPLEAP